jgi:type IV pilus assembly protein PilM
MVKKGLVGIDIGGDSIKVVRLKGLKNNEIAVIAKKKIGREKHEDNVCDVLTQSSLKQIAKEQGISQSPCASIIIDSSVSTIGMKLPPMPRDDLIKAVKFEAKKHLTYPISEAIVDYMIKDRESPDDPMLSIIAVAVKKEAVDKYMMFLKDAGFKPAALEIGALPLIAAFDHNYSWEPGKKTALLDIGGLKSNLLIVRDKTIRFYRDIPVYGSTFTNFFQEAYELPYAEADEKKIKMAGRENIREYLSADVLDKKEFAAIYEHLALELQRSFDYYQARNREGPVNELVLSGGGALLHNIDEYLSDTLGIEVIIDNPFKKLYFSNKEDEERYGKAAPIFTTAVGLALRKG